MNILIAPDAFKESLSATQVAAALCEGLSATLPAARCTCLPLADGGEGTLDALAPATDSTLYEVTVSGPLGTPTRARYAWSPAHQLAIVELAEACGLELVAPAARDATATSSYGFGELIRHALDHKPRKLLLAIGGSATVDGGAGLCQALGVRFIDAAGAILTRPLSGGALANVADVDLSGLDERLATLDIEVACDVDNPLLGASGAATVFGPQKGADVHAVALLERNLAGFYALLEHRLGRQVIDSAGAGAAGGIGAALIGVLQARLRPGPELLVDALGFSDRWREFDLVITGEGRLDVQTTHGKTAAGIARLANAHGIPVIAVCGAMTSEVENVFGQTFAALEASVTEPLSRDAALAQAYANLVRAAQRVGLWLKLGQRLHAASDGKH